MCADKIGSGKLRYEWHGSGSDQNGDSCRSGAHIYVGRSHLVWLGNSKEAHDGASQLVSWLNNGILLNRVIMQSSPCQICYIMPCECGSAIESIPDSHESENDDEASDPLIYSAELAIETAKMWRAGKMIGGDADAVIFALLHEIERTRAGVQEAPDAKPMRGSMWQLWCCDPGSGREGVILLAPEQEVRKEFEANSKSGRDVWMIDPNGVKYLPVRLML